MSTPPPIQPPPPPVYGHDVPPASVPNHLVWTIVSTVLATCLCCPLGLLGIVGIVYSTQVNSKLTAGDVAGAQRASNNARTWAIVATVLAVIGALWSAYWWSMGGTQAMLEQIQAMQAAQQH